MFLGKFFGKKWWPNLSFPLNSCSHYVAENNHGSLLMGHLLQQSPTFLAAAAAAKSLQSCPTLWDPVDGSPSSSPIPGILQARTLERVAISFSNAWSEKWKWSCLVVWLLATQWTAAYQAPPSMGFSRQEYWSGVPLPSLTFLAPRTNFTDHNFSMDQGWRG